MNNLIPDRLADADDIVARTDAELHSVTVYNSTSNVFPDVQLLLLGGRSRAEVMHQIGFADIVTLTLNELRFTDEHGTVVQLIGGIQ